MAMKELTFEELTETNRAQCELGFYERIEPGIRFERDLGVTGDDGEELLEAVGERFGVTFTRESFALLAQRVSLRARREPPRLALHLRKAVRRKLLVRSPSANFSNRQLRKYENVPEQTNEAKSPGQTGRRCGGPRSRR